MKFINIEFSATRGEVVDMITNNELVNRNVRFDESLGKPLIKVKNKKRDKIKIFCEMIGGPSKDNGFVQGTSFRGKLVEKNGHTRLRGIITTEPVYHIAFLLLIALFVVQCFRMRGFSVIPPILVIFDIFMFKNEFKKQGYIKRYLYRAQRRLRKDNIN